MIWNHLLIDSQPPQKKERCKNKNSGYVDMMIEKKTKTIHRHSGYRAVLQPYVHSKPLRVTSVYVLLMSALRLRHPGPPWVQANTSSLIPYIAAMSSSSLRRRGNKRVNFVTLYPALSLTYICLGV